MKNVTHSRMKTLMSPGTCTCLLAMLTASAGFAENDFSLDPSPAGSPGAPAIASYADVLEPARSAVVSVTTASIVETMGSRGRSPMEEFLRRYYGMPDDPTHNQQREEPSERRVPHGLGSGVIVSEDIARPLAVNLTRTDRRSISQH